MVILSIYKYRCRRFRRAFILKDSLVLHYLHQAGRGSHSGVGPIYSVPPFLQRGHDIGSFLSGLFGLVRPVLWSGVKEVVLETLRTGGRLLSDLADNTVGDVKPGTSRNMSAIRHKILFINYGAGDVKAPQL